MRERTDKTFPNHSSTAKGVWDSIINPVNKKHLLDFITKSKYRAEQHQQQALKRPTPHHPNGNHHSEQAKKQKQK